MSKEQEYKISGFKLQIMCELEKRTFGEICKILENAFLEFEYKEISVANQDDLVNGNDITTPNIGYTLGKTYTHKIENVQFDGLSQETLIDIYKDGRVFSHLIEHYLVGLFPSLVHVPGCKDHDFNNKYNKDRLDEKTFTKNGCKFMPSSMIGTGRKFDNKKFEEHCNKIIYCIVSNVNFPEIKIRFEKGCELMKKFPIGNISSKKHDEFFGV